MTTNPTPTARPRDAGWLLITGKDPHEGAFAKGAILFVVGLVIGAALMLLGLHADFRREANPKAPRFAPPPTPASPLPGGGPAHPPPPAPLIPPPGDEPPGPGIPPPDVPSGPFVL